MKITINYGEDFFNNTIADSQVESLKKLKNIGFEGLDYAVGRGGGVINPIYLMPREKWVNHFKEQRKMIEGEGLEVCQTHATYRSDFDADYPFEYTQKVIDHYKKEIEATNILGCKHMVLHPITKCIMPFREEVDVERKNDDFFTNVKQISKLKPALKEFGVKACLENMFLFSLHSRHTVDTGYSSPEDMVRYLDGLDCPECFCACLDTGHMNVLWHDVPNAVRTLGDKLEVLHVHDNHHTDAHQCIGLGDIDWFEFVKALKDVNYKGNFNLELIISTIAKYGSELAWRYIETSYLSAKAVISSIKE